MLKFIGLLFIAFPLAVSSQSIPLWRSYYDSAHYFWKEDIEKSVILYRQAERIALLDLGMYDENYLTILNDLGLAYGQINNLSKAEEYLLKYLSIHKELYTSDDARLLVAKYNLATLLLKAGNEEKAKAIFYEILSESLRGNVKTTYVSTVTALIRFFESNDQFEAALSIVKQAMSTTFFFCC
jgi:tetratricopeptide (TPR) repeat protein